MTHLQNSREIINTENWEQLSSCSIFLEVVQYEMIGFVQISIKM